MECEDARPTHRSQSSQAPLPRKAVLSHLHTLPVTARDALLGISKGPPAHRITRWSSPRNCSTRRSWCHASSSPLPPAQTAEASWGAERGICLTQAQQAALLGNLSLHRWGGLEMKWIRERRVLEECPKQCWWFETHSYWSASWKPHQLWNKLIKFTLWSSTVRAMTWVTSCDAIDILTFKSPPGTVNSIPS